MTCRCEGSWLDEPCPGEADGADGLCSRCRHDHYCVEVRQKKEAGQVADEIFLELIKERVGAS